MQDVLASLSTLLEKEKQQLSAGNINSNQRITEDKGVLLSTLNYLDGIRRTADQNLATPAPYRGQSDMASRWVRIQQHTPRLQDANVHNGLLLQHQIRYTQDALQVLKPHQT